LSNLKWFFISLFLLFNYSYNKLKKFFYQLKNKKDIFMLIQNLANSVSITEQAQVTADCLNLFKAIEQGNSAWL